MTKPKLELTPEPIDVALVDAAMARDNARIEPVPPLVSLTLRQKLRRVMGSVGYVQKKGRNAFHKYNFVQASDVAEKAHAAFTEWGLLFLPTVVSIERRDKQTKDGFTTITCLTMNYTVMDVDSDDTLTFTMVGEGADPQDKGPAKALTACFKYALLQLLMVSTGDDPEADSKTDEATPVEPSITDAQLFALQALIHQTDTEPAKVATFFQVADLKELSASQYLKACALLEKKK